MRRLAQWDSTYHTELKGSQFETHRWARPGWALGANLIIINLISTTDY